MHKCVFFFFFFRLLMSSEELRLFDKVRVYLDEDYSSAENFTVSMKYLNMCVLNSLLYVLNIIFKDFFFVNCCICNSCKWKL
jgi:hypothetical protein